MFSITHSQIFFVDLYVFTVMKQKTKCQFNVPTTITQSALWRTHGQCDQIFASWRWVFKTNENNLGIPKKMTRIEVFVF